MRTKGFGYIGLLILLAVMATVLAAAGSAWSTATRREREARLLYVGGRLRAAIVEFHDTVPAGQLARFPRTIDELLLDPRFPTARRHLRSVYRDPMDPHADWIVVRAPDGGIAGVRSAAAGRPFKRSGFGPADIEFDDAEHYADWYFGYPIEDMPATAAAPARASSGIVLPVFGGGSN